MIEMKTPLVEMDGDEMTRVLWQMIKDKLILPFVNLKSEYYDLGLKERDRTGDEVTVRSADAAKKYGVAVKCATITPNKARMSEYNLKEMWKSPNATIRGIMDGTIFRAPIIVDCVKPAIPRWLKPITIARHAYGDVYKGTEIRTEEAGSAELVFTSAGGTVKRTKVADLRGASVLQGTHNTDESIESFANACFKYAIDTRQDLWFSTKDTISKTYDGRFRDIFESVYEQYKPSFEECGMQYFYTLIDDAVARAVRSEGGFIWALKNYDGDVMSDMVSTVFGSLSMMTSVLVSPDGKYEYEAAHGTITQHYYRYLKGETPTANPIATVYAWSGALKKRGELDGLAELERFGESIEASCIAVLNSGIMTKDLAQMAEGVEVKVVNTGEFIDAVADKIKETI